MKGNPQVLVNYAPVSREPWKLEALIDPTGHPATSRFNIVRPVKGGPSLGVLWAVLNSPIANAFVYCMSGKRDILPQYIRRLPVPNFSDVNLRALEKAVAAYLNAAQGITQYSRRPARNSKKGPGTRQTEMFVESAGANNLQGACSANDLKILHWRIDAEVLRLYNLPSVLERQVLDLFSGIRRRGVPFEQTEYFRKDFTDLARLQDLLAITVDWERTNLRRAKLLDLEEEERITPAQQEELDELQRLADASVSLLRPVQMEGADEIIEKLKRAGAWEQQP